MNLKTVKYKAITFSLISMLLFSTGCKDFLDRDSEDGRTMESIQTFDDYLKLTGVLYGGDLWLDYQGKFAWVVNEGLSGNLWNIYEEQGALFLGDIAESNAHIRGSYTCLYSGVISAANNVINMSKPNIAGHEVVLNGVKIEDGAKVIEAEAKFFRGLALFLATEYWGEVPLITNNEKIIAQNLKVPKANRATLYKAIENDWLFAAKYLPDNTNWRPGRVNSWSAKGMLVKLYLTMASCQVDGLACPYLCPNSTEYYDKAIAKADEVIASGVYSLESYAEIFALKTGTGYNESKEALVSLHFVDFGWGAGAHWQSMMAYNEFWAPSAGWGGWTNLTWTLFEAFHDGDLRKKETCFYAPTEKYNEKWYTWDGREGWPYNKYNTVEEKSSGFSGSQVKNNIKKYVYGYDSTKQDGMSSPMRMDFLRYADVLLMKAEAEMAKATGNVTTRTMAGMELLRDVVGVHGGAEALADLNKKLSENGGMAFYEPVQFNREISYKYGYLGPYVDENGNEKFGFDLPEKDRFTVSIKVPDLRIDFIQERRKEFAMEGQAWWDVKRLYYRCPECAKQFFKEQDRGWEYSRRWSETGTPEVVEKFPTMNEDHMDGYARTKLIIAFCEKYPNIMTTDGQEAKISQAIHNGTFDRWFLPISSSVEEQIPGVGQDFTSELGDFEGNGFTYKY
jgi:hypothetical protein